MVYCGLLKEKRYRKDNLNFIYNNSKNSFEQKIFIETQNKKPDLKFFTAMRK
jgi:hypothetical protein